MAAAASDVAEVATLYRNLCDKQMRIHYGHGLDAETVVDMGTSDMRLHEYARAVGDRPRRDAARNRMVLEAYGVRFWVTDELEEE